MKANQLVELEVISELFWLVFLKYMYRNLEKRLFNIYIINNFSYFFFE